MSVQAAKLIRLLPDLTQQQVSDYILTNKSKYPILRDIIVSIQEKINSLDVHGLTSLIYVTLNIGGAPLLKLPDIIKGIEQGLRAQILSYLQALLARTHTSKIAAWMCAEWHLIEEQTLGLIRYLRDLKGNAITNYDVLTLSKAVDLVGCVDHFVVVSEVFLDHPNSKWMLQCLTDNQG